ncbi:MAG: MaoC/PaaZ C-terminal domain-containing protein [Myxococcota bacterium]|nr:MaoC/PaaZ C-terminal domain-containing protein [Myxococcota bacterium]
MSASTKLDFESLYKGMPLEGLSIPALTRATLARFAGAIDDYNPLHLDDKVATASGKASVFAPGHLIMAYVGRVVEMWLHGASLRHYSLRMSKLVWPGDVLTCRGLVVDKMHENGEFVIDANVWADNQRGETVAKGRFIAVVPESKAKKMPRTSAKQGVVYQQGSKHSIAGKPSAMGASSTRTKAAPQGSAASKKTTKKKTTKKKR